MALSETDYLLRNLQFGRDAIVWKVEGLSEYDARRPLTATGTNLLGLVKHLAGVEYEYFHDCMGRDSVLVPWLHADAAGRADGSDMWATAEESTAQIVELYRAVWAADDAVVRELGLDAEGFVPWWGGENGSACTVRELLIHMIAETHRHAGHADILREGLDGSAGWQSSVSLLPGRDSAGWIAHVEALERIAREA